MVPQPHKEERFLYVLYPFLCAAAAVSSCAIALTITWVLDKISKRLSAILDALIMLSVTLVFVMLSISRIANLQVYNLFLSF